MSFGGYNPLGTSDLPFTTPGGVPNSATMRSRTSSLSSVHSSQGIPSPHQSQAQPQPPLPPPPPHQHGGAFASQPSTPGIPGTPGTPGRGLGEGYFNGHSSYSANSYESYGSNPPSPGGLTTPYRHGLAHPHPQQQHQHPGYGNVAPRDHSGSGYSNSGYDSPTSGINYPAKDINSFGRQQQHQQQVPAVPHRTRRHQHAHHHHQRTQSNASETSLNIDTSFATGSYSPGPVSLSSASASSSRRNSVSDASGALGGSFFPRQKATFRPRHATSQFRDADNDDDDDEDDAENSGELMGHSSSKSSPRRLRPRKPNGFVNSKKSGSKGRPFGSGSTYDWDILLPSTDTYDDDEDEDDYEGLTENEKWKKRQLTKKGWESSRGQSLILATLVAMAVFVRIWKVAIPASVVSDEQHFGGFTADYLKGQFFMDVHPPLGKMLYAAAAYLLGFDGKFDFVPGRVYGKNVPYIGMRLLSALCGVGLVPISYMTIKNSGHSTQAAIICAILMTFDNALITQSRFILLDAPMMLFLGYTVLSWINFYNFRNRPFTRGCVKWVGLFTIATVGLCVLKYLQESRTHLYTNTRNFSKQFMTLFLCLLVLPFVLYMGLFAIDFQLLTNSGSGNSWVSPQFQMTLKHHDVPPVMADLAWESKIHIRHANTNGGWVHSMPGEYTREGAVEQAIQLVEWDDDLTCWQIFSPDEAVRRQYQQNLMDRKSSPTLDFTGYIYDGDKIRLRHCYSKVALATHDLESIGSNKSFIREIRGVKWEQDALPDEIWTVELVPDGLVPGLADGHQASYQDSFKDHEEKTRRPGGRSSHSSKQWHSIKGFRLFNDNLNCYLQSHKVFRSQYSSYQEVGCIQGDRQKSNTYFIVDRNENPHLPASTKSLSYKPLSFFQKFIELNRVMWWSHHDLSSPIHGGDYYSGQIKKNSDESLPWSWPFLSRGLNYFSSKETNQYIYLMGNPLLWWAASTTAIFYMCNRVWSAANYIRGIPVTKQERARFGITPFYAVASGTFFAGWAIHFFPFFFMKRQLYLHHYLPALYFSILLLVSRVDRVFQRWPTRGRYLAGIVLVAVAVFSWHCLAPLAYGHDFSSRSKCEKIRSVGGWEFVCQRQNLPYARPQTAKIVAEKRSEHEGDKDQEEMENDQVYQDAIREDSNRYGQDHDHEHDHDHDISLEDHEHDHEGPFNENESEHYEHEHFHHPGQHHDDHSQHQDQKHSNHRHAIPHHDEVKEVEARNAIVLTSAHQQQAEAARLQSQAAEERAQVLARSEAEVQAKQQEQAAAAEAEAQAKLLSEPKGWEARYAIAEARAQELKEKADLLVAKAALEEKQRELEQRLREQEQELLLQKLAQEQYAQEMMEEAERAIREKNEQDRQQAQAREQQAQERQRQSQQQQQQQKEKEEEDRQKLEREEIVRRAEEEQRLQREEAVRRAEEERQRLEREEIVRRAEEERQRLEREETVRRAEEERARVEEERARVEEELLRAAEELQRLEREEIVRRAAADREEEKRARIEEENRLWLERMQHEREEAEEDERRRAQQKQQQEEAGTKAEEGRRRKEQEEQKELQRKHEEEQEKARLMIELLAAKEVVMGVVMGGGSGDFGGVYSVAQPPPPGPVPTPAAQEIHKMLEEQL
ncbi:hypothetical protein BG004_006776 [Podila humilis]|nr:hypothetical protein BG004_006776 [Podila humilis]